MNNCIGNLAASIHCHFWLFPEHAYDIDFITVCYSFFKMYTFMTSTCS